MNPSDCEIRIQCRRFRQRGEKKKIEIERKCRESKEFSKEVAQMGIELYQ